MHLQTHYNPSELVTFTILENIIDEGYNFVVLQRVSSPEIASEVSFIASPYYDLTTANLHVLGLPPNECEVFDLNTNLHNIMLLINSKSFKLFIVNLKHRTRSKKAGIYKGNIGDYTHSKTTFKTIWSIFSLFKSLIPFRSAHTPH